MSIFVAIKFQSRLRLALLALIATGIILLSATAIGPMGRRAQGGTLLQSSPQPNSHDHSQKEDLGGLKETWKVRGFNGPVTVAVRQPDGKLLVGGHFTRFNDSIAGYLLRLNADGTLDAEFSRANRTGFDDAIESISLSQDGEITVQGAFSSFDGAKTGSLARLFPDGSLDTRPTVAQLPREVLIASSVSRTGCHQN